MVGDEIPIPQTQFQAGAAGGVSNIPVTSYQYKSVGVDVKITPTIHRDNDVTLKIKLKLDFITGYRGDFPTLGKRELEAVIRLKEGESSIVGGFIKDEVRGSTAGIPALSKLPILGKLFGRSSGGIDQKDLIFSITPRVIRHVDVKADDVAPIWADTDTGQQGSASDDGPTPSTQPGARPGGLRPGGPQEGEDDNAPKGRNAILLSPTKRKLPVSAAVTHITLRLSASTDISSLSVSGSISGPKAEIEEVKTEFFRNNEDVKVLKSASGDSFDLGYTFTGKPIKNSLLAQLKVKFLEKGTYTISVGSATAYGKDRNQVELTTNTSEIEVY